MHCKLLLKVKDKAYTKHKMCKVYTLDDTSTMTMKNTV